MEIICRRDGNGQPLSVDICFGFVVELDQLRTPDVAPLLKLLSFCATHDHHSRKPPVFRHQGDERPGLLVAQGPTAVLATVEPIRCENSWVEFVDPVPQLGPMPERPWSDPFAHGAVIGWC